MGHFCNNCKRFGHGWVECNDKIRITNLKKNSKNDVLPKTKHCEKLDCYYKHFHTTRAHHCSICNQNHSVEKCPLIVGVILSDKYFVTCPICQVKNEISRQKKGRILLCIECHGRLDTNTPWILVPGSDGSPRWMTPLDEFCSKYIIYKETDIPEHNLIMAKKALEGKNGQVYIISHGGIGITWYIRRDFIDGTLLGLILRSVMGTLMFETKVVESAVSALNEVKGRGHVSSNSTNIIHSKQMYEYGFSYIPFVDKFIQGYIKVEC